MQMFGETVKAHNETIANQYRESVKLMPTTTSRSWISSMLTQLKVQDFLQNAVRGGQCLPDGITQFTQDCNEAITKQMTRVTRAIVSVCQDADDLCVSNCWSERATRRTWSTTLCSASCLVI